MSLFQKAAKAAIKARELGDLGQLASAQEAYLIAIEFLKMYRPYASDREFVQT
jgi:hypothetical protein